VISSWDGLPRTFGHTSKWLAGINFGLNDLLDALTTTHRDVAFSLVVVITGRRCGSLQSLEQQTAHLAIVELYDTIVIRDNAFEALLVLHGLPEPNIVLVTLSKVSVVKEPY
jgi:hypothetical protein